MPISVVIPAHKEEDVIERCLTALAPTTAPEDLEVVVVCNGCDDRTAARARTFDAQVVETPTASKTAAINLGDAHVSGFPRFYVDADVVISLAAARRIAAALEGGRRSPRRRRWILTSGARPGPSARTTGCGRRCRTLGRA